MGWSWHSSRWPAAAPARLPMPSCSTASPTRRTSASASRPIKKAETDRTVVKASRDRVAEAAKRRKSVQDSLKELEEKQKVKNVNLKKPPLKVQIRQAGMRSIVRRFYIYSVVCGVVLTVVRLRPGCAADRAAGRAACRRARPAALVRLVPPRPSRQGLPQRISECARHHRARRQVRPAAQRRHPADRQRIARAGQDRIPPHRRSPADRPVDSRCRDAHDRNHALPGGQLLRHRHPDPASRPAAIFPKRSATCRACSATARR